ncbi:class I SAM-dependent methyltransferase, partial [bacterium]|nr:class I SAM-dependent methyltransferase [bacterium]
ACCKDCGLFFNNPRPTFDAIQQFYSAAQHENSWMGKESEQSWNSLSIRRFNYVKKYKKKGKILDIGCGIGRFLNFAKNDFSVFGTEISKKAVRLADNKYSIKITLGDFDKIDFDDEKFDVITLWHSLEHVLFPGKTLTKIRSLLSEDGVLIIAVPNDDGFWLTRRLKNFILNILNYSPNLKNSNIFAINEKKLTEIHLSHFSEKILAEYLSCNGFVIIDKNIDPYFVSSGFKLLKHWINFFFCYMFNRIFKENIYETILITASLQKK